MMKSFVLMFAGSLCAWFCCDPPNDDYPVDPELIDRIAVLIVDDATNQFEGGMYYHYNEQYPTYNLEVENIPALDAGYIKVKFVEGNQIIYHASQIFNGTGQIIVPNPLKNPSYFDKVLTDDFVSLPESAVELTNEAANEEAQLRWAAVQGLLITRMGVKLEHPKIHYFKQNLNGRLTENDKWIFIIKY